MSNFHSLGQHALSEQHDSKRDIEINGIPIFLEEKVKCQVK